MRVAVTLSQLIKSQHYITLEGTFEGKPKFLLTPVTHVVSSWRVVDLNGCMGDSEVSFNRDVETVLKKIRDGDDLSISGMFRFK